MKVHDKYVIEIEQIIRPLKDVDSDDLFQETEPLAKIKGFKTLVFDEYGLDKLEKYDDVVKKVGNEQYERGYRAGGANNELYKKKIEDIQKESYTQGFSDGARRDVASCDLTDRYNKGYDEGFKKGKEYVIRAVENHIKKTNEIVNIWKIIDEYEHGVEEDKPFPFKYKFHRIIVSNLNERPYYEIEYFYDDGMTGRGYGTYDINVVSEYLRKYFDYGER